MNQVSENLKKSCQEAAQTFQKINKAEFSDLKSKLEWCIGSYVHDQKPKGLFEYGIKSLDALKSLKSKQPKMVTKKVIDNLEKAILSFNQN